MGSCGWLSGGHCEERVHDHAAEGEPHGSTAGGLDAPAPSAPEMDETGRIVELIRSMPERYREALELRFAWEYSNQEIAKALKLNTSTVATLVVRGRKLLIEKLQTEGYCYE